MKRCFHLRPVWLKKGGERGGGPPTSGATSCDRGSFLPSGPLRPMAVLMEGAPVDGTNLHARQAELLRAAGLRSWAGYFRGFHHDALERSEIAVVLSTKPAFKLKAGVGSEPRIPMKIKGKPRSRRRPFWNWERDAAAPCFPRRCSAVWNQWTRLFRYCSRVQHPPTHSPVIVSLFPNACGPFGSHIVLRAACKPICGRNLRPIVFCAVTLRACGRDGEPRTVPT